MDDNLTRRTVLAASLAALPMAGLASAEPKRKQLLAPALKPGDTVALIAPASKLPDAKEAEEACSFIKALGYRPIMSENANKSWGYLSGTDEERAHDLNWAFKNPEVRGIVCIKGGYGAMRILPRLDYAAIRRHPKVLVGYSDVTALLNAIYKKTGLVTFHGPVATSTAREYSTNWLQKAIGHASRVGTFAQPDAATASKGDLQLATLHGGKARGRLVGGNLTLLSHLMATPYEPDFAGKILFIEDVTEAPYRIDRMLTQLWLNGALGKVKGVAVGQFTNCDEQDSQSPWKCKDVIELRLKGLGVPVLTGLPIGHVADKLTLPVGAMAVLDADKQTLSVVEPAVC
ncbi:MAG: LD-carboxypeptidase [Armatimonadetes bacterium]|nr:LD-carboxypeptidase [Armatimonadota bacterium]